MAERERGIGRGLAAILSEGAGGSGEVAPDFRELPVDLIAPNPQQPRRRFDDDAMVALAESLRIRGVLQPLLVRPVLGGTYQLIAGERRWRAAQMAGLATVPAVVQAHADADSLEIALIENMAREDLNPVEEARACSMLVDELGLTREEIGRRVGRSRVAVSNLMRLLDLPDDVLDLLETGALTEGHGRALLMAPDHDDRRRLARAAAAEGWTVREVERRARSAAERPEPSTRHSAEPHPDQLAAAASLGDLFAGAMGADVRVAPRGSGYRVSIAFGSLEEAHAAVERLGITARA
ncbi:MAG: Chromosome (plasmid) partitioning protein ParB [uncultured Solirubrobacteraceae bacterium]|uniref:Chromosome (Plasmid) partitioning protein ParB n=1 Tax=uncultured Solirubrobacteraceae bacterium TaxID=1162706 RepID=A0A6J4T3F1_9ACTN|nr:MAG: Chromosome (plasmid) partitioning protein ParB [uncultured Solirubrobacteraceae bacterium]